MDLLRATVAAIMLIGAAWMDIRRRQVPNRYWFPFMAYAAMYVVLDVVEGHWLDLLVAVALAGASYVFWLLGLWGGADAKGVMVLAFLVRENLNGPTTLPALDALMASLMLLVLWPVSLFIWNACHGRFSVPAMFLGRPVPVQEAKVGWYSPLESVEGRTHVWVTPQLPFMAFIAAGFLLANAFGSPFSFAP